MCPSKLLSLGLGRTDDEILPASMCCLVVASVGINVLNGTNKFKINLSPWNNLRPSTLLLFAHSPLNVSVFDAQDCYYYAYTVYRIFLCLVSNYLFDLTSGLYLTLHSSFNMHTLYFE